MFQKLLSVLRGEAHDNREADLYTNLIRHEAKIGGELFGPIPEGGKREFFCLDKHTWIWHEEWIDANGSHRMKTTRYDVRPDGVLKAQDGQHYQKVSKPEAERLLQAARLYKEKVQTELYAQYV